MIGLGVTALLGTAGYIAFGDDAELGRIEARLVEIENEINANNLVIEKYNTIKGKIKNAIDYLENGKTDFANGGHVLDNVPLANAEFSNVNKNLNQAITNINNINNDLNCNIIELQNEKRKLNARKAELNG